MSAEPPLGQAPQGDALRDPRPALRSARRAPPPPAPWSQRTALWALPLAYMGLIFAVSHTTWGITIPSSIPFRDKGVHFCEYLLLGLLCAHAARHTWPRHARVRTLAVGALIAFAWGLGDELHQAFVPGRSAELLDLSADALGALSGALIRGGLEKLWPSRFVPKASPATRPAATATTAPTPPTENSSI